MSLPMKYQIVITATNDVQRIEIKFDDSAILQHKNKSILMCAFQMVLWCSAILLLNCSICCALQLKGLWDDVP